jgi:hypothetical protein
MTTMSELLDKAPVASAPAAPGGLLNQEAQRAVAEVQGAILVAKRFPRNEKEAFDKILLACQRPSLAESAIYTYARGGTDITGPSIRLAEAMAQAWGNIQFGIRELEQRPGESIMESFAWDVESNVRQVKVFTVRHVRATKKGSYALEDPRDIYEMTANQGARRVRACILGILPGDIVEAAVEECEATMKAKADTGPDALKKLVEAFGKFSVTREQIEARIQRRIEAITAAQLVGLRKIYNSLSDGMSTVGDWFQAQEEVPAAETKPTGVEAAKSALSRRARPTPPPDTVETVTPEGREPGAEG